MVIHCFLKLALNFLCEHVFRDLESCVST
jgi:hypothetical protein